MNSLEKKEEETEVIKETSDSRKRLTATKILVNTDNPSFKIIRKLEILF